MADNAALNRDVTGAMLQDNSTLDVGIQRARKRAWLTPDVVTGFARAMDLGVIALASVGAHLLRFGQMELAGTYIVAVFIVLLLAANLFNGFALYKFQLLSQPIRQVIQLAAAWAVVVLVAISLGFLTKTSEEFSRIWLTSWGVLAFVGVAIGRILLGDWLRRLQRAGELTRKIGIYGTGPSALQLAAHVNAGGDTALSIAGVFDERHERSPRSLAGHPVVGGLRDLVHQVRIGAIDEVFIALPWHAEERILEVLNELRVVPVDIRLAPEAAAYHFRYRGMVDVGGVAVLPIAEQPLSSWRFVIKEIEDRSFAAVILLLAVPFMLLIALAIRLDSRGPILFRQKRYGFNDEIIEVFKFRTMHVDQGDIQKAISQATRDDPRVTRVGRVLRRLSLDEIPQLFNVLRGDMSIVGPRPHAVSHNNRFAQMVDAYAARHRVKPGITGWAQVNGWRGETDTQEKIERRVEHDLFYIDNWSVLLDMKILAMTGWTVLRGENAY